MCCNVWSAQVWKRFPWPKAHSMLGRYHPSLDVRSASADPTKTGVSERLVSDRGWRIWSPR
jgi:hypothetical protein